jgi:hypothetical protein
MSDWPPRCDKCDEQLEEPGGLGFGPPGHAGFAQKFHLCVKCWFLFLEWLK